MGPKLLKLKNYGFQKILGHKNLSPEKILEPGNGLWKILGHEKLLIIDHKKKIQLNLCFKNLRSQKIFDYRKFCVLKNFVSQEISVPKSFGYKKMLGLKTFWISKKLNCQKILGPKNFGSK